MCLPAGIEIAEDHLLNRAISRQRLNRWPDGIRDGVADADIVQILDRRDEIPDLPGADPVYLPWVVA